MFYKDLLRLPPGFMTQVILLNWSSGQILQNLPIRCHVSFRKNKNSGISGGASGGFGINRVFPV